MKRLGLFFCTLALCLCVSRPLHAFSMQSESTWQDEVSQLDAAIAKLTNLRNLELAKAARAQDQGDRLQFNANNVSDARRYWNEADTSREIAARYQEEIDKLEVRRQTILKAHGVEETKTKES